MNKQDFGGGVPYLLYNSGTLGGCSNMSLNGLGVVATRQYLTDTKNISIIGGTFMLRTSTNNSTSGCLKKSAKWVCG
ncbi:hypothetical protein DL95DRAFT_173270 [Leptodontidium sp. 2 PMI_412]|nr:hypothetical protein DL95DRAFT_173270 [Leptodontidium sp. 2 PMI_412]